MNIPTFELEKRQSLWENKVEYNLTESGIEPLSLRELLTKDEQNHVMDLSLGYGQTNGDERLRDRVADLYGKNIEHRQQVLITNGSSEANLLALHYAMEPGDELIFMMPNYQQLNGLAQAWGYDVQSWWLRENQEWQPRFDELESLITKHTRMLALCNPNNPTGQVLSRSMMEQIVELADRHDLFLYADEVYRGASLSGEQIPSFADLYSRAVVCSGLSKSYALPGLRLGWLAGPDSVISEMWRHRDYTSIASGMISQYVAERALEPSRRAWIQQRNRELLNENLETVRQWIKTHGNRFQWVEPDAGGIVFLQYDHNMSSTELTRSLRKEESVFLVAGDCFGLDQHLRIGIGSEPEYLKEGLRRFDHWMERHW